MNERRVIDCEALWTQADKVPGLLEALRQWCRSNGIDPKSVPVHAEMVVEDSAFGLVIRYLAYLTDGDGRPYVDPENPDQPAMSLRTALLAVAPPNEWIST
ncbi:hypothetical protein ACWCPD_15960 [Streptomyces sp. NPDC001935]